MLGLLCVVEDDLSLRGALGILLTAAGFTVAAFESAEAFLAFPRRQAAACVLIDIGLPGVDGFSLQEHLAREAAQVPVVLMSGRELERDRLERARALGAVGVLRKPFGERELIDALQRALGTIRPDE